MAGRGWLELVRSLLLCLIISASVFRLAQAQDSTATTETTAISSATDSATSTTTDSASDNAASTATTFASDSATSIATTFASDEPTSTATTLASDVTTSTATSSASGPPTSTVTPPDNSNATCSCGFLDSTTNNVWTDSIIVYFNQTNTSVPSNIFSLDSFANPYEKGWFTYYREGASAQNVMFESGSVWNLSPSWLSLNITAATPEHLVTGAQLQTVRQDILYGTFRVFMRSPAPYAGGSALSMKLAYNDTSSAELDLLNMDDSTDDACMQGLVSGNLPSPTTGINYTTLETSAYNIGPWDFWEWRMDWDSQNIDWWAGANKTLTNSTANASLVDVPTAFYLKHWSNGEADYMQGPPTNNTSADIGYIRMFFNSSMTSTSQIDSPSCDPSQLCDVDDWTLRVTTDYTPEQAVRPVLFQHQETSRKRTVGVVLIIVSLCFSAALLIHAIVRKAATKRRPYSPLAPQRPKMATSPYPSDPALHRGAMPSQGWTSQADFEMEDLKHSAGTSATTLVGFGEPSHRQWEQHLRAQQLSPHRRSITERPLLNMSRPGSMATLMTDGMLTPDRSQSRNESRNNSHFDNRYDRWDAASPGPSTPASPWGMESRPTLNRMEASTADLLAKGPGSRLAREMEPEGSAAAANPGAKPVPAPGAVPQARTRVDYLAGLVAVCSLLVSCTHFILTFVPSVIEEYLPGHYESEYWARRTIEPFFFNEVWVGLFFTTSTRFLTSGYLRTGNLKGIAEKVVCRCPRLMIPITAVILFEYFLMDLGAVTYLEYIPSITWSTWPSTTLYTNFGYFIDETLQLFYLIPNAAPQLTWNYCTGVLWTIPVQLQNSWLVLLGVVIIMEIKTPWKRFSYYAFCILNHWYAMSWGSYFWFGLLLADLDITYKYRKSIHARAWLHYPLLTLAIVLCLLSLANDLFSIWTGYTFSTNERGIHPEPQSDLPLAQTALAGYPAYIEPKLNGLVFAVASQYIVELSTAVQWVLSTRIFLWLFPHVFTIYLIHGLIFWSIGSLVCVYFAGVGLAFWLNILLTALICYVTLFAILPIVTPVMEMLGKEITKGIWIGASEEPPPRRPTSYPFALEEIREMVRRKDDDPPS